jgi:hypothetical protein
MQPNEENLWPVSLQDQLGFARNSDSPLAIHHHHTDVLFRLLRDLKPSTAALPDTFAASMSAGLTHIASKMHADRRARDKRAAESSWEKTLRDKYGKRIVDSIILLTRASDDGFIPAYYQELGGCQKGDLRG